MRGNGGLGGTALLRRVVVALLIPLDHNTLVSERARDYVRKNMTGDLLIGFLIGVTATVLIAALISIAVARAREELRSSAEDEILDPHDQEFWDRGHPSGHRIP
jgi:hypothetical protein